MDGFGVAGRVDALLKAAQKSGMAVYVIDPRSQVRDQRSPVTMFVKDLARHTGAIAVVGEPDAREAARRIMTDAGHYYVLGFRADETVRPGMYRKIRVSCVVVQASRCVLRRATTRQRPWWETSHCRN